MTYSPPRPASTPTVSNLQASLDRYFGHGIVTAHRYDSRHITVLAARGLDEAAASYVAGWFEAKRRYAT